nr:MAG TPA: minor tail protein [Caudoviricetes sp.]DAX49377.1 MAG TPA: minor tail protein [Caudoviricetes sp.]
MDEKENTGTESSAVTAIKVKVVIDTNKKELDKQFDSVKEHYKEKPVKIAFGVNQNDTIRNINDALDKVVKSGKLKTPKVTLDVKIDQSKVTAQLKKAMQSAAKQTIKVNTGSLKNSAKANSSDNEFQKLYQLEQKRAKLLVDSAALTANGKKESELKAVNDELEKINTQMKELYENIKNVLSEKQKLQLTNMDSEAQFKASRKTLNGTDNATQELKKQQKATEDDLKRTIKQQESIYENRRKQIQALENYAKNNSNYKNSKIQTYLYGEDGTGNTSGKIKELREQLSLIENTDPSKTVKDFDKNCKTLDGTLDSTSQYLKELGFDFRDIKQANVDMTKFKSVYERATKLESSISNKSKYSFLIDSINGIKSAASGCEGDVTELSARLSSLEVEANRCGATTETLSQKLSRLFKEHFQTAVAMYGVAMVKQGLREVYNNVVDIDDAMVELKKVTTESTEAYSQFSDRAAKTSRDLGASISDYVSATADWARLGYGLPDAEELARVSTLLKNVGDGIESVTDASSYMTSVLKGFNLVAEDAQKVADLVNEVANNEPASAEDILEILTRSGAALHEAGNDLDQAVALGVAMNSVTQNAESTGQTLKTVSMYLRAAKTDLTAMGESTDGCANSVSELRSELKKLTGVDIMADAAGTQFKSTYDILMEISKVWGKLTDVDRANVTELLGGKRNANSVSAVLSQFQIAEKSMKDAANSAGSAAKENEVYLTSITGKLNQLDSAFQQFSKDLLDSSLIKFFVDFATAAVDIADGAVKAAGALPTLTAAISGVLSVMQMSGKLKNGAGKVNMPSYICCV